jgi:hypothetical protein
VGTVWHAVPGSNNWRETLYLLNDVIALLNAELRMLQGLVILPRTEQLDIKQTVSFYIFIICEDVIN